MHPLPEALTPEVPAAPRPAGVERGRESRLARWVPAAILSLAAAPRIWAAAWDQSLFWPDEIFQTLEQAHRFAFGYGVIPWEFRDGARSWLFPGALGLLWKAASALRLLTTSPQLVIFAKLLMAAASVGGIAAGMALAGRLGGKRAAWTAGLLAAALPPSIVYGSRVMTETLSGPVLVLAAYLLLDAAPRRQFLAGALASLSIYLRYQNGLVAVAFLLVLLAQRRWREARWYALGATIFGLAGGMLDWVTWGAPFKSFAVYVKFNLIDGKASSFGTSPFLYFAQHLESSIGPAFGVLLLGLALSVRRARGLVLVVLAYFVAHSLIPHKELRFILPILPLGVALAGVGLAELLEMARLQLWAAGAVVLALVATMGWKVVRPTRAEYGFDNVDWVIWHLYQGYFESEWEAARRADLCGIILAGSQAPWTGAYTYLHRPVPLFFDEGPTALASSNYLVAQTHEAVPLGYQRVFTTEYFSLYRREGSCAPPPPGYRPSL